MYEDEFLFDEKELPIDARKGIEEAKKTNEGKSPKPTKTENEGRFSGYSGSFRLSMYRIGKNRWKDYSGKIYREISLPGFDYKNLNDALSKIVSRKM